MKRFFHNLLVRARRAWFYYFYRRSRYVKCPSCGHRKGPSGEAQAIVWDPTPTVLKLKRQCSMCSAIFAEAPVLSAASWNIMPAEVTATQGNKYADREPEIVKPTVVAKDAQPKPHPMLKAG
jgi:hypothetical protein